MSTPNPETIESVLSYLKLISQDSDRLIRRNLELEEENTRIKLELGEALRVKKVKESSLDTMVEIVNVLSDLSKSLQGQIGSKIFTTSGQSGVDFERASAKLDGPPGTGPDAQRGETDVADFDRSSPRGSEEPVCQEPESVDRPCGQHVGSGDDPRG